MINILKLGHAEFEARDLPALAAYYCEVMGLTVTDREPKAVYLTSTIEHHSVVLRSGTRTGSRRSPSRSCRETPATSRGT